MSDSNRETISIHGSSTATASVKPQRVTPPRLKAPRPFMIAGLSIALLVVGWGAWSYLGSLKLGDGGDEMAEIDGIELVTPLFDPPKSSNEPTVGSGASPSFDVKNRANPVRIASSHSNHADGSVNQAQVWLTGTIEVDETYEKIELPKRISGGPDESSIFR